MAREASLPTHSQPTAVDIHQNSRVPAFFPRQIPSDQQPLYTREGQTLIHGPGLVHCLFFIKFYWKAAMPSRTHMIYGCFCTVGARINGGDRSSRACEAWSIIYSLVIHRKGLLTEHSKHTFFQLILSMATILKKAGKEAQWLRPLGVLPEDSNLGPTPGSSQPPGARAHGTWCCLLASMGICIHVLT